MYCKADSNNDVNKIGIRWFLLGYNSGTSTLTNLVNLSFFACAFNQLTTLNVSNLHNLNSLFCSSNQLTVLDVANLDFLTRIEVGGNLFTTLDFSNTGLNYNHNNFPFVIAKSNGSLALFEILQLEQDITKLLKSDVPPFEIAM